MSTGEPRPMYEWETLPWPTLERSVFKLLSRFMAGKWLGQGTLDALAALLDLHVATGKKKGR